jgi:hypothetical protein
LYFSHFFAESVLFGSRGRIKLTKSSLDQAYKAVALCEIITKQKSPEQKRSRSSNCETDGAAAALLRSIHVIKTIRFKLKEEKDDG